MAWITRRGVPVHVKPSCVTKLQLQTSFSLDTHEKSLREIRHLAGRKTYRPRRFSVSKDARVLLLRAIYGLNIALTAEEPHEAICKAISKLNVLLKADISEQEAEAEYESHSAETNGVQSTNESQQTTQFTDDQNQSVAWVEGVVDRERHDIDVSSTAMGSFLSRPVRIATRQWAINDSLREVINPWRLFLDDPAVAARTRNFAYIRGTLHIKAMINGNSFYYGRSMLSYNPIGLDDEVSKKRTPGNANIADNVSYSQRPHIFLDPTESIGGEMSLPFFWFRNWIPFSTVNKLGELTLSSINRLQHANGAIDPVTINIFAWMTEVELAAPTDVLESQASDEYGMGVISKPASALARIARKLANVPVVAPYATATALAAEGTGRLASLFGYCRPQNIAPIEKYRPTFLGNMANTEIAEALDKLSFDPKQELTIDPGVTGYKGGDDMSFQAFKDRESFVTKFTWSVAQPPDSLLFSCRVNPTMFKRDLTEIHTTPLSFMVQPFNSWRGAIRFRLQIVAAAYHKGRLRIVYDPLGGPAHTNFNTTYTRIVDISDSRDIEFDIGWNREKPYLDVAPYTADEPYSTNSVTPIARNEPTDNGVFYVYVLNQLVRPSDLDTGIPEINMFVKAADDFEVANPTDRHVNTLSYFESQGGDEEAGVTPQGGGDVQTESIGKTMDLPGNTLVHFGEAYATWRSLLKRYNYHSVVDSVDHTNLGRYTDTITRANFPEYRGFDPFGIRVLGNNRINYTKLTLLNYLAPAYAARRGGLRWKFDVAREGISDELETLTVQRSSLTTPATTSISPGDFIDQKIDFSPSLMNGAYVTPIRKNPTAEIEFPYYSANRFESNRLISGINRTLYGEPQMHDMSIDYDREQTLRNSFYVKRYCSTGEDFNLIWFINTPVTYQYALPVL
jgi:hypothetical protein